MNPTILILTGELSGDQHIATIIPDLKKHYPDASLHALGGPALQAAEVPCFATIASLNVMGLFHAIKRLPSLLTIYFRTKQMIHLLKPDLTIMVDSPAFNLRLCKFAAQYGKVLYYITPKVWAHGQKRITIMQAYIHHLAVIFPFEAAYFKAHDIPCTYVGNPVYQAPLPYGSKDLARAALNIPKDAHVVGLLPGSRPQEITAMLPILANTAKAYHRVHPKTIFLLPLAPTLTKPAVAPYLKDTPIRMIDRQSRTIMQASDFLIITSGTATLEAAHVGTPMAIIYKVSRLTALWAKQYIQQIRHIGLPNILEKKTIVPEILQDQLTVEALIEAIDQHRPLTKAHASQITAFTALATRMHQDSKPLIDVIIDCLAIDNHERS